jgi:hypothetical protein
MSTASFSPSRYSLPPPEKARVRRTASCMLACPSTTFFQVGERASSKSAMKHDAPELRALMTILASVGPVISTRRSCRSAGVGPTRQSPSRTAAVSARKTGSTPASSSAWRGVASAQQLLAHGVEAAVERRHELQRPGGEHARARRRVLGHHPHALRSQRRHRRHATILPRGVIGLSAGRRRNHTAAAAAPRTENLTRRTRREPRARENSLPFAAVSPRETAVPSQCRQIGSRNCYTAGVRRAVQ